MPSPGSSLPPGKAAGVLASVLSIRPEDLTEIGRGDFCIAFERQGEVIRVARHEKAAGALRRETCVLDRIGRLLPAPVPALELFNLPDTPSFTVHQKIEGEILTADGWRNAAPEPRDRISNEVARFVAALHDLPPDLTDSCGLDRIDTSRRLSAGGALVRESLADVLCREEQAALLELFDSWNEPEGRASILHSDLSPGHLLWDPYEGRLTGVIDFGDVSIGAPFRDLTYLYEDFGEDNLQRFLKCYDPSAPVDEMVAAVRKWHLLELVFWADEMMEKGSPEALRDALDDIGRELRVGFHSY